MLPFACFPLATLRSTRLSWVMFCVLVVVSLVMTFAETMAGQHFPYQELIHPFSDYVFPSLIRGDLARNFGTLIGLKSWISVLPLFAALLASLAAWCVQQRPSRHPIRSGFEIWTQP
jgi:hypothetical protein